MTTQTPIAAVLPLFAFVACGQAAAPVTAPNGGGGSDGGVPTAAGQGGAAGAGMGPTASAPSTAAGSGGVAGASDPIEPVFDATHLNVVQEP